MVLRWGVIGAATISPDFITAIQTLPVKDHKVVAVCGTSREYVEKFAKEHDIRKEYNSYTNMAQDNQIDIVYIQNLNKEHFEVCKMMMEYGKSILFEKPFTLNEKQIYRLVEVATDENVFLMEAQWSRCFPAYKKLKEIIDSAAIGEVLSCSVDFGQNLQHVKGFKSLNLSTNATLQLGIQVLQFQQFVFRGLKPVNITITDNEGSNGGNKLVSAIITYPEDKTAEISFSSRLELSNEGVIVGTKGTIKIPNFWSPTEIITADETYNWSLPESPVPYLDTSSAGLKYGAEEAKQCIDNVLMESSAITHDESIELARLMDLLRKQLGVTFPEDSKEF